MPALEKLEEPVGVSGLQAKLGLGTHHRACSTFISFSVQCRWRVWLCLSLVCRCDQNVAKSPCTCSETLVNELRGQRRDSTVKLFSSPLLSHAISYFGGKKIEKG